jgi:hypothetical protein
MTLEASSMYQIESAAVDTGCKPPVIIEEEYKSPASA